MWSVQQQRAAAAGGQHSLAAPQQQPAVARRLAVVAMQAGGSGVAAEGRERAPGSVRRVPASAVVGSSIRYRIKPGSPLAPTPANAPASPVSDFMTKVKLAWRIFFPEAPPPVTPKEEGKQRLRMILVADRCGMSPTGLADMKRNILKALEEFVDIEDEQNIDVSISMEPELGTIYSVAVPIRRVKPEARVAMGAESEDLEGVAFEYDPEDWNSDPSGRFPYGC